MLWRGIILKMFRQVLLSVTMQVLLHTICRNITFSTRTARQNLSCGRKGLRVRQNTRQSTWQQAQHACTRTSDMPYTPLFPSTESCRTILLFISKHVPKHTSMQQQKYQQTLFLSRSLSHKHTIEIPIVRAHILI